MVFKMVANQLMGSFKIYFGIPKIIIRTDYVPGIKEFSRDTFIAESLCNDVGL